MNKNYWTRENVRLRALEASDAEHFMRLRKDPDSMREFMEDYIELPKSEKDIQKEFADLSEEYGKNDKHIFIIESLDGEYAGMVSVWYTVPRNHVFKYGIYVDDKFRGQHMAKNALIIVLDYYFNELGYHKVSPMVYEYNETSQKFHKNFGFVLEGTIRQELYTRGQHYDMLYYGMTKEEFNQKYTHFYSINN